MSVKIKALLFAAALSAALAAPAAEEIALPAAQKTGGMPLMDALAARHSERAWDRKPLSDQELSNLLWSAFGVNRPNGKRTIPTAMNRKELIVYVSRADGVWRYEPEGEKLVKASGPGPSQLRDAPDVLLFAILDRQQYGPYHAGLAAQSAGLYCASAGLACVVRAFPVRDALASDPKAFSFLPEGWKPSITLHAGHAPQ